MQRGEGGGVTFSGQQGDCWAPNLRGPADLGEGWDWLVPLFPQVSEPPLVPRGAWEQLGQSPTRNFSRLVPISKGGGFGELLRKTQGVGEGDFVERVQSRDKGESAGREVARGPRENGGY